MLEKFAAHPQTFGKAGFAARCEIERFVGPREDVRKGLLMIADLLPLRISEVRPPVGEVTRAAVLVFRDLQFGKLFRMRQRQQPQPYRVQQLEDGRVGPDPQSQRQRGNCKESGVRRSSRPPYRRSPSVLMFLLETFRLRKSSFSGLFFVPGATQYRQPGILRKTGIYLGKFTQIKDRAAIRLDPPHVQAAGTQPD